MYQFKLPVKRVIWKSLFHRTVTLQEIVQSVKYKRLFVFSLLISVLFQVVIELLTKRYRKYLCVVGAKCLFDNTFFQVYFESYDHGCGTHDPAWVISARRELTRLRPGPLLHATTYYCVNTGALPRWARRGLILTHLDFGLRTP